MPNIESLGCMARLSTKPTRDEHRFSNESMASLLTTATRYECRTHHIRMSATNASPMPRSTRMNTSFIIHNYAVQEATPMAPARAVSTAMRILRICFQSGFIFV